MPVYEYRCSACGRIFERLTSMSSRDEVVMCPSCGMPQALRLLSIFAAFSSAGGETSSLGGGCCGGSGGGCACRA